MEVSLHTFRCLVNIGEKCIQKQNELLNDIGVDIDFTNDISKDIRNKCNKLGRSGWVISPLWEPNTDEMWYNTWYNLLEHGEEQKIVKYFKSNNYQLLNDIRGYTRSVVGNYKWWTEAEKLFDKKYYIGCAMILSALLEQRIRNCPIDSWRQKVTEFFDKAIHKRIEDIYNDENIEPIARYIDTLLLLPSVDGFIDSYFNSGYRFQNKIEPDYLERNWLMHGFTKRDITEDDCIKLFNVICSLCYTLHALFGTDYRP